MISNWMNAIKTYDYKHFNFQKNGHRMMMILFGILLRFYFVGLDKTCDLLEIQSVKLSNKIFAVCFV